MQDSTGTVSSVVDVALRTTFTDDPLLAGMTIRAVHLAEIVGAANLLRNAAGLQPFPAIEASAGAVINAAYLQSLRTAINEARVRLGAYAFPFSAPIAQGNLIRASDFRELREAVR